MQRIYFTGLVYSNIITLAQRLELRAPVARRGGEWQMVDEVEIGRVWSRTHLNENQVNEQLYHDNSTILLL